MESVDSTTPLREATGMFILVFLVCFGTAVLVGSMTWLGSAIFNRTQSTLPQPVWGQPSCATVTSSLASSSFGGSSIGGGGSSSSSKSACASFAVIASNDSKSTADSFPLLAQLQKVYPLSKYTTRVLPASLREPPSDPVQMATYVTQHLRPAVMSLDGLVAPLVKQHYSLIHLPSTSALLIDAWVRGLFQYTDALGHQQTTTFFDGKTLAQRYPGQRFSVSNVVLSRLVEGSSNGAILRFGDVVSAFDPKLLLHKFATLGLDSGSNSAVLVVNQQGDLGSSENYARLAAALPGSTIKSVGISYTGTTAKGTFAPSQVQTAVNAINQLLSDLITAGGSGPVKLIVVLNPATYYAAQEAFATAFDGAFGSYVTNSRVVFFGLGFTPRAGVPSVGYPIVRGVETVNVCPNPELTALGFASDATTLQGQLGKQDLYVLDAAKFAQRCCTTATCTGELGYTGHPYQFDPSTGTVIARLTHDDGVIAPHSTVPTSGVETGLAYNGRASGRATVPPLAK